MLKDPHIIEQIDLLEFTESEMYPNVVAVTQEHYDLLRTKDPYKIYIIADNPGKIYHGSAVIHRTTSPFPQYLLGPSTKYGEYNIYLNIEKEDKNILVELFRFNDPQKAIDILNLLNKIGYHHNSALQSYNILLSYINRDISIHDLLIGIISLFGYGSSPDFDHLVATTVGLGARESKTDFPLELKEWLSYHCSYWHDINPLYQFYSNLYNVVVKYNYFKEIEYNVPKPDLSGVIEDIYKIMLK